MRPISWLRSGIRNVGSIVADVVRSYAEVFFLSRTSVGFVLVVGTLLNWRVGLAGLIAVAAAYGFARLLQFDPRTLRAGYYTYNPLLVGLSLGATLSLSWLTAVLIAVAGAMTFALTASLVHFLRYYLNLPALSLPFVLASAATHVATLRYAGLAPAARKISPWLSDDFGLPMAVAGFLKSLGAIFFVPSVLVGGLFAALLFVRSRILFGLAVGGYFVGTSLRGALIGSSPFVHADVMSFNFLLTAMAVGGIFLVPSWTSFGAAAAAVAASVIVIDAVQVFSYYFAVPAYTLPFNLVTLGILYALTVNRSPCLTKYFGATPEETLENELVRRRRFDAAGRPLELPFLGRWSVWQGNDDHWTHQGDWRYAYDFVVRDDDGQTHTGAGAQLRDFYCYRKPIVAPCRGTVVAVVDDLPDNPPGRVDAEHNWGNYVVLHDERGFYVELSHFAYRSIKVRVGDRVAPGTVLGLCGNSGYSPQPHLHVHVQATERVGSETLPFSFRRFTADGAFVSEGRPTNRQILEPVGLDEQLSAATDFQLTETYRYEVFRNNKPAGPWSMTVKLALDGTFYFESSRGGRLYFGKLGGTFYCYRVDGRDELLDLIQQALPSLPLVALPQTSWSDAVPIGRATHGWRRFVLRLLAPFAPRFGIAATTHRFVGRNVIETTLRIPGKANRRLYVELDDDGGFASFRDDHLELRTLRQSSSAERHLGDNRKQMVMTPALG